MTVSPQLSLVVAMGENGAIGRDNALLWKLRTDMRRFRQITMGHPVIMGRKTWDSIGRPLPGRDMIVLSRQAGQQAGRQTGRQTGREAGHSAGPAASGVLYAADLAEACALAGDSAARRGVDSAMVLGGAEIYAVTLPLATRIYLTLVQDAPEADAFFPGGPDGAWRADFVETARESHPAGPDDEKPFVFIDLLRKQGSV